MMFQSPVVDVPLVLAGALQHDITCRKIACTSTEAAGITISASLHARIQQSASLAVQLPGSLRKSLPGALTILCLLVSCRTNKAISGVLLPHACSSVPRSASCTITAALPHDEHSNFKPRVSVHLTRPD